MDVEIQPRCGLMFSLIMMNMTAIALFFFATPPGERSPQSEKTVPAKMVLVGDAKMSHEDENKLAMAAPDDPDMVVVYQKTSLQSSCYAFKKIQAGKVEIVNEPTMNQAKSLIYEREPPFKTALKKLVMDSKAGMQMFFKGLKNGYSKKQNRTNGRINTSVRSKPDFNNDPLPRERTEPSTSTKPEIQGPIEVRRILPGLVLCEDRNVVNETFTTDVVLDVLSKTQKRTNELINIFSERVVPAIERMNDKVADAVRLEKNLDSYTATLINAIGCLMCSNNLDVKKQRTKPRQNVSKNWKQTESFVADLCKSGGQNDNERREVSNLKRPVFKTLTARCWHSKYRRISRATSSKRCKDPTPTNIKLQLEQVKQNSDYDMVNETVACDSTEDDVQLQKPVHQITIGIEDVLTLTSTFEEGSQGEDGESEPLTLLNINSGGSTSSGTVSSDAQPQEMVTCEFEDVYMKSEKVAASVTTLMQYPELKDNAQWIKDPSFAYDSNIQVDDGIIVQQEIKCLQGTKEPFIESSMVMTQLLLISTHPNTSVNLLNSLQHLNLQQKEMVMENVCLLVLRMFDACTERQPISSRRSGISLSSSASTDEFALSRPCTAIRGPRRDSKNNSTVNQPKHGVLDEIPKEPDINTQISRHWLKNVSEAAEMQLSQRQTSGGKVTVLHNPSFTGDVMKNNVDPKEATNQSGFGDIKDTGDEEVAGVLIAKSRESLEVSKESSAATFYTGQPESSEDAFYECTSTLLAATCGSLELEVQESNKVCLKKNQEEEQRRDGENPNAVAAFPAAPSCFSVESWLTESGEALLVPEFSAHSEETPAPDHSFYDVVSSTDDESVASCSTESLADGSQVKKDKKGLAKKKKWGAMLLRKILKRKSKSADMAGVTLPRTHNLQTDSVINERSTNENK